MRNERIYRVVSKSSWSDQYNNEGPNNNQRPTTPKAKLIQQTQQTTGYSICQGSGLTFQIHCYNYGELRHCANECSKIESYSSNNMLIKEPAYDVVDFIYDDSNNSQKILYGDGGANLVI